MRSQGSVAGDRRATLVLRAQELPRWCEGWNATHRGNRAYRPPGRKCSPVYVGAQKGIAKPGKARLKSHGVVWG